MPLALRNIQAIYLAYFGRPADPDGLEYWQGQTDLTQVANAFAQSSEYRSLFASEDYSLLVSNIYENLYKRAPETEEIGYWVKELNDGNIQPGEVALAILEGATGTDAHTLKAKLDASEAFTAELNTATAAAAYKGSDSAAKARTAWADITDDVTSTTAQDNFSALIESMQAHWVNNVQKLYVAYYGRPADPAGLSYWVERAIESNGDWASIAESFATTPESQALYGNSDPETLVNAIYLNVLGRAPEAAGNQYWIDQLNQGTLSPGTLALAVANDTQNADTNTLTQRIDAAKAFTLQLESADRDDDFTSLTTTAAAREWLAGIGSDLDDLTAAIASLPRLVNTFVDGNVQGTVVNGYIAGATVFIDENGDGLLNPGEISVRSDNAGNFLFPVDAPTGTVIAMGGINITTGQVNTSILKAPAGATTVTPLTNLVQQMIESGLADGPETAEDLLFGSLGLPKVDLSSFDPLQAALNGTDAEKAIAIEIEAITSQIANTLAIGSALLQGAGLNQQQAQAALLNALSQTMSNGSPVDLTASSTLENLLQQAAINTSPTVAQTTGAMVNAVSQVLGEINSATNEAALKFLDGTTENPVSALSDMFKLATLVQTQVTEVVQQDTGSGDTGTLLTQYTGTNLVQNVDPIQAGSITPDTPTDDGTSVTNGTSSGSGPGPQPDTTAPAISAIAISGATGIQNDTLNEGDVVSITITMSEATVVDTTGGTPQLALTIDSAAPAKQATYASGSGTSSLVFTYTIEAGLTDSNGISIDADRLTLSGGTLKDAAGNDAVLTHDAVAANPSYRVDTSAPTANFGSATDDVGSITGALAGGSTTDDTALVLSGSCEADSTVNVYDGTTLLGAATVTGTSWSFTATVTDSTTYQFNVRETDAAGNISAATSNFTVTGDTAAPTLNSSTPSDDVTGVAVGNNLTLTFSENIALGSGNITLKNLSGGSDIVIDVSSHGGILSILGSTLTINPSADLPGGTDYSVRVDNGAVTDIAGNAFAGISDDTTLNFTTINEAPAITAGGSLAYTENDSATTVNSSLTLTDAEGDNITGATITISANYANGEDTLSFTPTGSIIGSFNAGTGVLTLSGTGTAAEYQTALRSVTYNNTSDAPSTSARTISFEATDSHGATSTAATTTVNVAAVNDAPVNTVPANADLDTAFSNTAMSIAGVSIADVDAGSGTMTVALSASNGGLTVSLAGGASVSTGTNGTGSFTLSGTASQLNAALSTLSYKSNDGFTGTDTITVTTDDGSNTGSGGAKTDTDSFQVGVIPEVFIIDNADGTADDANSGSAANPFNSIASFNTNASDGSGDYIYIKNGTGTYSEANGLTLLNDQQIFGQGQTLQFTNPVTGEVVTIGTGASGTTPTLSITGASATGVTLAQGNTLKGFNLATTQSGQTAIKDGNGTVGNLSINDMDVTGTGMGVDIDQGGALNVSFDTLSSTGSSQQGVQLAGSSLSGTFSATSGSISGSANTGFQVGDGSAGSGGTAAISYGGTLTLNTGASNAISATNMTGGSLTFSGNMDLDTTSGTGIYLSNNNSAINFTGSQITVDTTTFGTGINISSNSGAVTFNNAGNGLDITTSDGMGLTATGGGTLSISGTSNSINSINATAINVNSTTIGASGLNFESITSRDATNGILLNNTGSTGGLTVTGNDSADSGGTISNTNGDAVVVTNGILNLSYMLIQNTAGDAIYLLNPVGSSTVGNSTITNFGTSGGLANTNNGIHWVTGSNTGTLTINNTTFSSGTTNQDGIFVDSAGSGAMNLTVTGSTFTGLHGDGIQVTSSNGSSSVIRATIEGSSFNTAAASGKNGILLSPSDNVTLYADVNSNTFSSIMLDPNNNNGGINVSNGGIADADITIRNNTLTAAQGIVVGANDIGSTTDLLIDNNNIDNLAVTSQNAIWVGYGNQATGNATLSNNNIGQGGNPLWSSGDGNASAVVLRTDNGASLTSAITNNTVDANTQWLALDILSRGDILNATLTNNDLDAQGAFTLGALYTGTDATGTLNLSLSSNNLNLGEMWLDQSGQPLNVTQVSPAAIQSDNNVGTVNVLGSPTYSAPAPSTPTTPSPPLLLDPGSTAAENIRAINEDELIAVIEAAANRWNAQELTNAQQQALGNLSFALVDMEPGYLAAAAPGLILIDSDAGGQGWFVDATPMDDLEFSVTASPTHLYATDGAAAEGIDLLTALMHEIGHALGYSDLYGSSHQDNLMHGHLSTGERLLPSEAYTELTLVGTELGGM